MYSRQNLVVRGFVFFGQTVEQERHSEDDEITAEEQKL